MSQRVQRKRVIPLIYNKTTDTTTIKHVILIHDRVKNYQVFVETANSNTFPIVYNSYSSTRELLDLLHSRFTTIDRIAFVFHGGTQEIQKRFLDGNLMFIPEDIATPAPTEYSQNVQFIIDIFNTFQVKYADFLACDSLLFNDWKSYYDILQSKTTTLIGASNNDTGNLRYGADWIMESTEQEVRDIYFTSSISQYQVLLALTLYNNSDNVQYSYDPEVGTDAAVFNYYNGGSAATGAITLLSQFTVDGTTYNVTSIGDYSFYNADNITSITIPGSILTLGVEPFYGMRDLTSFIVSGGTSFAAISNNAGDGVLFNYAQTACYYAGQASTGSTFTFPSTTLSIENSAFEGAIYIESVTFNSGLLSIGEYAFFNASLGFVGGNVVLPASLTTLSRFAFSYCFYIATFSVDSSSTTFAVDGDGVLYNKTGTILHKIPTDLAGTSYTIPADVTELADGAIAVINNLTTLNFASSTNLITMGDSSMSDMSQVTAIIIPASVTTVGGSCASGNSAVTSILFENPNNISSFGQYFGSQNSGSVSVTYQFTANVGALNSVISSAAFLYDSTSASFTYDVNCFNKGTKILCINTKFKDEYIAVENLKKGDLVKSYKHGYRPIAEIVSGTFKNNPVSYLSSMYKMTKTEKNGLLEDLIITGGHAILVDELTSEQEEKNLKMYNNCKFNIDNKIMLLAGATNDFQVLEDNDTYTYYHFYLENDEDDTQRFGVWANNLLVETPNKEYFTKHIENK